MKSLSRGFIKQHASPKYSHLQLHSPGVSDALAVRLLAVLSKDSVIMTVHWSE